MTPSFLGIDVAKLTLDVALLDEGKFHYKQFPNALAGFKQLSSWLKNQGYLDTHVCLEATGKYSEGVAEFLHLEGFKVSMENPARIKFYANSKLRRNKTDKADAQLIAEYCQRENPAQWTPPPACFKDLQALVRHQQSLMQMRQQHKNRLSSGLTTPAVILSLQQMIAFIDNQIEECKHSIQQLIDSNPELRSRQDLLVSIPGIGKLTAAKLLGEIRDVLAFSNARQLAAYAGLTPRNVTSGTSIHKKSRLAKTVNAHLRCILYMPAISAKHWNPIVADFCNRLLLNGHKPIAVICAAMHKLLHIIFGVLKSGKPFDPNYLVNSPLSP